MMSLTRPWPRSLTGITIWRVFANSPAGWRYRQPFLTTPREGLMNPTGSRPIPNRNAAGRTIIRSGSSERIR
jgi:hypothetical protein